MSDTEIRRAILQKLYDLFMDRGRAVGIKSAELANDLAFTPETVEKQIRALKAYGFVENITMAALRISPDGLKEIEGTLKSEIPTTQIHQNIEISGGNIGQINQAHVINNPSYFLNRLEEAVENTPDIDPEKKSRWKQALWEMSKHPALIAAISPLFSLFEKYRD